MTQFPKDVEILTDVTEKARVIERLAHTPSDYENLSDLLRADKDVLMAAIVGNACMFRHAPANLRADRDIVIAAGQRNLFMLKYAGPAFLEDPTVFFAILEKLCPGPNFVYSGPSDEDVREIERAYKILEHASPKLTRSKDFMLRVVARHGSSYKYIAKELKRDTEIVHAATRNDPFVFQLLPPSFHRDRDFVISVLHVYPDAIRHIGPKYVSSDREILLLSARGYWYRTYPIDPALQCDREFMLELLSRNGMLYERLDEEIQKNTEYATVALASAIEMLRPMTTLSSTFPTNFAAHFAEIIFIMFENTQIRENTDLLQKLENGAKFMISNPMGDVRTYGAAIQRKLATLFETD